MTDEDAARHAADPSSRGCARLGVALLTALCLVVVACAGSLALEGADRDRRTGFESIGLFVCGVVGLLVGVAAAIGHRSRALDGLPRAVVFLARVAAGLAVALPWAMLARSRLSATTPR